MEIQKMNVEDLQPAAYNPRKDLQPGDPEYDKLKRSIEEFGYVEPIVYNKAKNKIVGGHQRLKVLKDLGYKEIEVAIVDLNDSQEKQLNLGLNKISGEWDFQRLADLILDLDHANADLSITGFEDEEIEDIMNWTPEVPSLEDEEEDKGSLHEQFIVPPFTVLDTRQGYWQDRKRAWLSLGIKSEEGRDINPTNVSAQAPEYMQGRGNNEGGSIFDPVLCELVYRWFAPEEGKVLDPFAGGSVRGIVASRLGYKYKGIDLRSEQVEANKFQANEIAGEVKPEWIQGDSTQIKSLAKNYKADLIFSCPPYGDLEQYSDDARDISNMDYKQFLDTYRKIISESVSMLKENRFACFVVGEIRDKEGFYRRFVPDTIQAFKDAGMEFYNEGILITPAGTLPLRISRSFGKYRKLGKQHQNILVFYKGDTSTIPDNLGEINVDDVLEKQEEEYGEEL